MAGNRVTHRVCQTLSELYQETGFKLEWAEAWTQEHGHKISRDTFSRAIRGRVKRLHNESIRQIASFIECETDGAITAGQLLRTSVGHRPAPARDLRGVSIEGHDWSGRDLRRVDLRKATLVRVDLKGAALADGQFQRATLVDCIFTGSDLVKAKLRGALVVGCDFTDADIRLSDWRHATIQRCIYERANHTGANMDHSRFRDCTWLTDRYGGGLSLRGADLSGLAAFSESHGVIAEVFRRSAEANHRIQMLAGWTDFRVMGCYQVFLHLVSTGIFRKPERRVVLN